MADPAELGALAKAEADLETSSRAGTRIVSEAGPRLTDAKAKVGPAAARIGERITRASEVERQAQRVLAERLTGLVREQQRLVRSTRTGGRQLDRRIDRLQYVLVYLRWRMRIILALAMAAAIWLVRTYWTEVSDFARTLFDVLLKGISGDEF